MGKDARPSGLVSAGAATSKRSAAQTNQSINQSDRQYNNSNHPFNLYISPLTHTPVYSNQCPSYLPTINSNINTPKAHMSTGKLCACVSCNISGDKYSGVPHTDKRGACGGGTNTAQPKSATCTNEHNTHRLGCVCRGGGRCTFKVPSGPTRTFSGFKSLCTTFKECMYATADAMSDMYETHMSSDTHPPCLATMRNNSPCGWKSSSRYMFLSSWKYL